MELSNKQREFLDKVVAGQSVFLTGKAGTGKSYVVKRAIEELVGQKKRVVALAPTGIAANNIGGQTIHSMFGLNPYGVMGYEKCNFLKTEKRRLIKEIDVIVIDEVSMLRPDVLDGINWTMVKNGCGTLQDKQVVFVGDLKQLPPPLDDNTRSVLYKDWEGEEFFHAGIYKKLGVEKVELDEILRQTDTEFISALNNVRDGIKEPYFRRFIGREVKGVILAPHNSTVQRYNLEGLDKLEGKEIVFMASIQGNVKADEFNLESEIRVKDGAKIMYLVNSKNNPLVNGTIGTFVVKPPRGEWEDEQYFIRVENEEYALNRQEFTKREYVLANKFGVLELQDIGSIIQMPIRLAYALSIHKSQGMTFSEVSVDLSRPCFQAGQLYVALSRVTTPEGLSIIYKP